MKLKNLLKILGPGLLYAGAAVGVSHLVQSTRAGAMFNFDLVWILIIANILKYPFFEFGPRYAVATGNNLVDGYNKVGSWAVVLYAIVTFSSMCIFQAAITVVTVGLIAYVFNITISITALSAIVLIIALLVLVLGKYSLLDKVIKFIIVLLALSTIVAVFAAFDIHKVVSPEAITNFTWTRGADVFFMIAFVGWMPAPIDVSVWSSVWNIAKAKEIGYMPKLKDALIEFRVGYIGTAILALGFLLMGALVMYGTGEQFSPNGTTFSGQLIRMYTTSLGDWAYWLVSIAATATMISTTITVLDAYPRVLSPVYQHLFPKYWNKIKNKQILTWIWLGVLIIGSLMIIAFAGSSMGTMVSIATTLSFLVAPVLAWLNYRVVTDKHMPREAVPGIFLRALSWLGIAFFVVFSIIYIYWIL
ncbi:MAG: Nramp family divalent metal transporter [Bacteroidetes bacterium]|nr:Nramp family divalent metal transporter [Bacteroidota bacterium]